MCVKALFIELCVCVCVCVCVCLLPLFHLGSSTARGTTSTCICLCHLSWRPSLCSSRMLSSTRSGRWTTARQAPWVVLSKALLFAVGVFRWNALVLFCFFVRLWTLKKSNSGRSSAGAAVTQGVQSWRRAGRLIIHVTPPNERSPRLGWGRIDGFL